jgi:NAD(P)-dependent dehydrogenase (short-subunit alcohol dehydrogenase family)
MEADVRQTGDQAIIITGAGGGLGRAIVAECQRAFPRKHIVATDISPGIETFFGEEVTGMVMDVTDESSIASVKHSLESKGIRVWALVNNAGISDFFPVSEEEKGSLDRMFAVNAFGAVNMVRMFLPHLKETRGRVVNISSESVRLPAAFHPYAASKTALESLSVSMRNELALLGIRLIVVRPGAIKTPLLEDLYGMNERIGQGNYSAYLHKFAAKAPRQIRKIVPPERVAGVVLKALVRKTPRRYYMVNNNPLLRFAQVLPHRIRDHFMMKMLKS